MLYHTFSAKQYVAQYASIHWVIYMVYEWHLYVR